MNVKGETDRRKPTGTAPEHTATPAPERTAAPAPERYAAPALEKGLDLLEALAGEPGGIAQKQLAEKVGRSVGEIFRMLGVLERRGYVVRDAVTGHYALSLKLFELAHRHPPTQRLQLAALPVMQELAEAIGQSCHLVVPHLELSGSGRILVVAHAEPSHPMAFVVRLGALFPLSGRYVSARVLAAFQRPERRRDLAAAMEAQDGAGEPLEPRLAGIAARGYDMAPSETTDGVTDLSFPILDPFGHARAALTVPHLPQRGVTPGIEAVRDRLGAAAARISAATGGAAAQHGSA
jgi:DNA-binding IclR family transcriptional regulator